MGVGCLDSVEAIFWGVLSGGADVDGGNTCEGGAEAMPTDGLDAYGLD